RGRTSVLDTCPWERIAADCGARFERLTAIRNMNAMPLPRLSTLAAAVMLALCILALPASGQTVVVLVNGEPITNLDIEQRTKLQFLTTRKQAARQEILNELIDDKVKIKEGKKFGV